MPTGRTQTQRVISVGADTAPVDPACAFAEYDTRPVGQYQVVGLFLPVTITTLEHSEVVIEDTGRAEGPAGAVSGGTGVF